MFRKWWRRLFPQTGSNPEPSQRSVTPTADRPETDTVVLYARFGAAVESTAPPMDVPSAEIPHRRRPRGGNHRRRILGQRIERLGLCGPRRRRQLKAAGIATAEDLLRADLDTLVQRLDAPRTARVVLGKYRRAIRLAAAVPGLVPRDAMLLIHIHRRSAAAVASESPGLLHRDLQRFAWSSRGQRLLRGRPLPNRQRVRRWVQAAAKRRELAGEPLGSVRKRGSRSAATR